MRRVLLAFTLALPCLLDAACFDVDEPACAFKCGNGTDCPNDYECRADGYCHQVGSTETCAFTDASTVPDLSAMVDSSMPNLDLGETD